MGRSKRTSGRSILETLAAELWVKDANDVVKSRYVDGNGVAMVGKDHLRKESQFQAGVAKARIEQLMKGNEEERDDSSNISDMMRSKSITFLKEVTINDEGPEKRCAKDYLRAIAADIDPNYKEKTMARNAGLWSGYFGDRDMCDEESVEVHSCMCVESKSIVIGQW
eukprot:CAMPEP_0201686132 /NCGR_PEP_ID=MMETSP0578-20130828/691_1 /ASSEMBLY_ACC=CAM_ASM_000663 /TAXON_ID=267565 /ORGANISM="Skeletonema grethea, Strain CCMP 1804" /LENGTH=166 /DNA_ID=CAMNT_0048170145 /DNA_START=127 /DNA_END=627 /DNA_ORIENTATION=-